MLQLLLRGPATVVLFYRFYIICSKRFAFFSEIVCNTLINFKKDLKCKGLIVLSLATFTYLLYNNYLLLIYIFFSIFISLTTDSNQLSIKFSLSCLLIILSVSQGLITGLTGVTIFRRPLKKFFKARTTSGMKLSSVQLIAVSAHSALIFNIYINHLKKLPPLLQKYCAVFLQLCLKSYKKS